MLKKILAVANIEFLFMVRSKQYITFFILVPLFFCIVSAGVYMKGKVVDLPLLVMDMDNSAASRELISSLHNTDSFGNITTVSDFKNINRKILDGSYAAAVVIPKDFGSNSAYGSKTEILAICDGSNILFTNVTLTAVNEVVRQFSGANSIKILAANNLLPTEGLKLLQSISFQEIPLNNPAMNYAFFLVYGIQLAILQILAAAGPAAAMGREKEDSCLLNYHMAGINYLTLVSGKSLPYLLINGAILAITLLMDITIFGLPMQGSPTALFLIYLLFLLSMTCLGILCANFCQSQVEAIRTTLPFLVPAFIISGFTWPLQAMPYFLQVGAKFFPLTWGLIGVRSVTMHGGSLFAIWLPLLILTLLTLSLFTGAILTRTKYSYPGGIS